MPRITETLKQLTEEASVHFAEGRANIGQDITNYVNSRAIIEIADSLKAIESSLEAIKTAIGDYMATTGDRSTLEEMPSLGARSRKPKGQ